MLYFEFQNDVRRKEEIDQDRRKEFHKLRELNHGYEERLKTKVKVESVLSSSGGTFSSPESPSGPNSNNDSTNSPQISRQQSITSPLAKPTSSSSDENKAQGELFLLPPLFFPFRDIWGLICDF